MAQKPYQPTEKRLASRRKKRHACAKSHKRQLRFLALLLAALAPIAVGGNIVDALPSSESGDRRWNFEEMMENRQKYEPIIDAKCELYSHCEFETFNAYRDEGDLDGYSMGIMNAHPLFFKSVNPQTGAIKVFYNDRVALLGERFKDEEHGVHATITEFSLTWRLQNSDQTYELTDLSKLIPQQETELIPEGLEIPEDDSISRLSIRFRTTSTVVVSNYDVSVCANRSAYSPGQRCIGILDSRRGHILLPENELYPKDPTHYPAQSVLPHIPKPALPETSPGVAEPDRDDVADTNPKDDQGTTNQDLTEQFAGLGSSPQADSSSSANSPSQSPANSSSKSADRSSANSAENSSSHLPLAPNTGLGNSAKAASAISTANDATAISSVNAAELVSSAASSTLAAANAGSTKTLPNSDTIAKHPASLIIFTLLLFALNLFARLLALHR